MVLTSWPLSVLWVPQPHRGAHVCWVGFLLLGQRGRTGASAWLHFGWTVALARRSIRVRRDCDLGDHGAVVTGPVPWTAVLTYERRWSAVLKVVARRR